MIVPSLVLLAGLAALVWGSDRFVHGAAATARNFGVSPLIIGLTVVGVGTSMPEILVSVVASLEGNTGLAIGNAVGSNIANIGLVAGAAALVRPISVRSETLRREFPMMLAVTLLAWMLLADGRLGRFEGAVLLLGTVVLVVTMLVLASRVRGADSLATETEEEYSAPTTTLRALILLVIGLLVLLAGSRAIVWGAVAIARAAGVSDLVIGLTIVAIGTSLPELAASVAGVLKGEGDIAIGNVLGSNMFNLLPVLAMPGLIAPGEVPHEALSRDLPVVFALSIALAVAAIGRRGGGTLSRPKGGALLLAFVAYQLLLYGSMK